MEYNKTKDGYLYSTEKVDENTTILHLGHDWTAKNHNMHNNVRMMSVDRKAQSYNKETRMSSYKFSSNYIFDKVLAYVVDGKPTLNNHWWFI